MIQYIKTKALNCKKQLKQDMFQFSPICDEHKYFDTTQWNLFGN